LSNSGGTEAQVCAKAVRLLCKIWPSICGGGGGGGLARSNPLWPKLRADSPANQAPRSFIIVGQQDKAAQWLKDGANIKGAYKRAKAAARRLAEFAHYARLRKLNKTQVLSRLKLHSERTFCAPQVDAHAHCMSQISQLLGRANKCSLEGRERRMVNLEAGFGFRAEAE